MNAPPLSSTPLTVHRSPPGQIEVPRATERIRVGMPSTAISAPSASTPVPSAGGAAATTVVNAPLILDATENFITFLDALKLNFRAKDQLHPLLSEVIQSVNKVAPDFEDRGKIVQWLITLNQMKATEELSEQQARELDLDMNQAYQGFKSILSR